MINSAIVISLIISFKDRGGGRGKGGRGEGLKEVYEGGMGCR